MPVTPSKVSSTLQLKVKTGTDTNGKDIISYQNYRRVKVVAADTDLYSVAQSISSLQSAPLLSVIRVDNSELVNEG